MYIYTYTYMYMYIFVYTTYTQAHTCSTKELFCDMAPHVWDLTHSHV